MPQLSLQEATNQAMAHLQAGRGPQGIAVLRQLLATHPDHPGILVNLGIALHTVGQMAESVATFQRLTQLQPAWPDGWNNLGVALRDVGRREEAIVAFRSALNLHANQPAALDNLGAVLQDLGRHEEAIPLHERAIALQPNSPSTLSNLANAFKYSGRINEAIATFRRAIALAPNDPSLHHYLGLTLLYTGDFEHGLAEHEWRCRIKHPKRICQDFPQPKWNGEPLQGRRILIHAEQGLGDTIQFVRYVPFVVDRGGRVILQCPPELLRLLKPSIQADQVIFPNDAIPAFDVHCPLMSLPWIFKTTLATIPAAKRYLQADPARILFWKQRLDALGPSLKVGLAWAGKPSHVNDRQRSIPAELLGPLAQVQGVQLISLQKSASPVQPGTLEKLRLFDWTAELTDMMETASLVESLDLVITVDTAVAHLAGALGKPVWVLLPFVPDWRWFQNREDTTWYPSIRRFRQTSLRNWQGVIGAVESTLRDLIGDEFNCEKQS